MSDHHRIDPPADTDLLAGEYVLGVLDDAEHQQAEARLAADPAFARAVEAWQERLTPLAAEAAAVEPPPELLARIEARLGRASEPIPFRPRAANDDKPLRFWRAWAMGSTGALAASLAAVAVLVSRAPPPPVIAPPTAADPARVATLVSERGGAMVVIAYDPRTRSLYVAPAGDMAPGEAVPHLWLLEPDGKSRLVGVIDARKPATHNIPVAMAGDAARAVGFAVSMEPQGHVPTEAPGGPVVAKGDVSML